MECGGSYANMGADVCCAVAPRARSRSTLADGMLMDVSFLVVNSRSVEG